MHEEQREEEQIMGMAVGGKLTEQLLGNRGETRYSNQKHRKQATRNVKGTFNNKKTSGISSPPETITNATPTRMKLLEQVRLRMLLDT